VRDLRASTPARITRVPERREVVILWRDGHESHYDWEYLRRHCPCALCAGEAGMPGSMGAHIILQASQVH